MARVLLAVLFLGPGAVFGEGVSECQNADHMEAGLIDWYGERAIAESVDGDVVLWHNDKTESWTLLEYHADGTACALDSGTNWPSVAPATLRKAALDP